MENGLLIGQLSQRVGVPTPTIRYYEQLGILDPAQRDRAGSRIYFKADEQRLRFVKKAKRFGLSLNEIKQLIDIRSTGRPPCDDFKQMLQQHITQLDQHLEELLEVRAELKAKYEQIDTLLVNSDSVPSEENCNGKICGLIENDS